MRLKAKYQETRLSDAISVEKKGKENKQCFDEGGSVATASPPLPGASYLFKVRWRGRKAAEEWTGGKRLGASVGREKPAPPS